jgi:hypothetical protein
MNVIDHDSLAQVQGGNGTGKFANDPKVTSEYPYNTVSFRTCTAAGGHPQSGKISYTCEGGKHNPYKGLVAIPPPEFGP